MKDWVIMAVTSSSPFFLLWVLLDLGNCSWLSPAEETVSAHNIWFIWAQTTFTLEPKDRITGCPKPWAGQLPSAQGIDRAEGVVIMDWYKIVLHLASENVHSYKGFWNNNCVNINSHMSFSKMGLCLFLFTLVHIFLGILNWIFRFCSAEIVVLPLSVIVLFPECLKSAQAFWQQHFGTHTNLHSPFLIHQELVVWQCSGKDLALWQSSPWECWQVRHQYLHSSWSTETFNVTAVCCKS